MSDVGYRMPDVPGGALVTSDFRYPTSDIRQYRLASYARSHGEAIANWCTDDKQLRWLAPSTVPPLTAEKIAAWSANDACRFVLLDVASGRPVGYAELDFLHPSRDQMWIGHLVIDPKSRGRGLGTRLVEDLLAMAFDRFAARRVVLLVFPENAAAVRCYQRAGFAFDGEETKYFPQTDRKHRFSRMAIDAQRHRALRR